MSRTYGIPAILLWAFVSVIVFMSVDAVATRPLEIYIEDLRIPEESDEQVLMRAVQLAHERVENWWWIHDSRPVIVLDSMRKYRIDPTLYKFFDVPVVKRLETGRFLAVHPIPAAGGMPGR